MQYFPDTKIQPKVTERLARSIENGRLAHAWLFYGPEGTGKEALAMELAKAVNCRNEEKKPCNECGPCRKINSLNHPDIHYVFPTLKSWKPEEITKRIKARAANPYARIETTGHTVIPIDRMRELKIQSKYTPYEADKKVYIISGGEKMTRESANSFLKLLEEPPESLLIILVTTTLGSMLDTIRSRCQIAYFPVLSFDEALQIVGKYREVDKAVEDMVHISCANLKQVFDNLDRDTDEKRTQVYQFLRASASGSALQLMETVDTITRARDKNYLMEILNLLILWFKDALHLTSFGMNSEIINTDFREEVRNFAKHYSASDFEAIVSDIEKSLAGIRQNVYNPLLLTVLGIRIKRNLVKNKS